MRIALIPILHIQNLLRGHDEEVMSSKRIKDSVNGMSVDEVILSLNILMVIGNTSDWGLTAVTKIVREIFWLEEPKSGQIILA